MPLDCVDVLLHDERSLSEHRGIVVNMQLICAPCDKQQRESHSKLKTDGTGVVCFQSQRDFGSDGVHSCRPARHAFDVEQRCGGVCLNDRGALALEVHIHVSKANKTASGSHKAGSPGIAARSSGKREAVENHFLSSSLVPAATRG